MNTTVEVWAHHGDQTVLVGRAFFTRNRGAVATTFMFDPGYLAAGGKNIDPGLVLDTGSQHVDGLLGAFADSAPDRWGRTLIEKAERARARVEGRHQRSLDDVDFLLGVSDDTRQGALRFRMTGDGRFLGDHVTVPAVIELPRLLNAANEIDSQGESFAAVKELLDTGTTGLGGARPKASVRLADGGLAIAKFPHASDRWNVMAWEATMLDLLELAGIRTPNRELVQLGDSSVLILRRFDRKPHGERIGYLSAMTATRSRDGDRRDYVDIVDAMRDLSFDLAADVRELFDRVVASVAFGNTDDHLRNHGFLARGNLWTLSPVFDVNPNPNLSARRATSIAGADSWDHEAEGLLAFASDIGLSDNEARSRIGRLSSALEGWQRCARDNGISEQEITTMAESIEPRTQIVAKAGTS